MTAAEREQVEAYRELTTVARLHHEVGTLIAAASFAVDQLTSTTGGTRLVEPRVTRTVEVLRQALREVTR